MATADATSGAPWLCCSPIDDFTRPVLRGRLLWYVPATSPIHNDITSSAMQPDYAARLTVYE